MKISLIGALITIAVVIGVMWYNGNKKATKPLEGGTSDMTKIVIKCPCGEATDPDDALDLQVQIDTLLTELSILKEDVLEVRADQELRLKRVEVRTGLREDEPGLFP